jgi:cytochrome c heme-lyase
MSADKCPVDHKSLGSSCPVDHNARSTWGDILPHSSDTLSSESASPTASTSKNATRVPESLSNSREVSSIPRSDKENWVYPSEAQFYAAMARKDHNPRAPDMRVVVPIHNAVNERAWSHIREWETGRGGECCGGVRLVSFKGRPGEPSPKARILTLLGYVLFRSVRLSCFDMNMLAS